jgi:chemotaxis protein methyltransferase CheR
MTAPLAHAVPVDPLDPFARLVRAYSGLELPESRRATLGRAVAETLVELGLSDRQALLDHLSDRAHRLDLEAFTARLTIGETHFFRNAPQLEALRTHVLPDLLERRAPERRLRIWSAGCATGEEPYSIAILIDALLPDRDGWNIQIHGTDINRHSLERARRGVYGPWSFRQVPDGVRRDYFLRRDRDYHLIPRIRSMVTFGYLNLVEDSYPSLLTNTQGLDLILCRNVLIYFREETVNTVVGRLADCLAPDGWLVAGHAEAPMPVFRRRLEPRDFPHAILYRRGAVRDDPAPVRPADAVTPRPPRAAHADPARPAAPAPAPGPPDTPDGHLARAEELWRAGRVDDALALLQEVADGAPSDARSLELAARILAGALRLGPAEHTARLALSRDPLAPAAHYMHGLILQELGRRGEALDAMRRCVYLDPGFALGHYALASLLLAAGHPDRADRSLVTAIGLALVQRQLIGREGGR